MPIWKLQCAFAGDSALPRDRMVITPHFNDSGVGSDPQALCDDLAAALGDFGYGPRQVDVTAYDAQGTAPVYPAGHAVVDVGASPTSQCPREVALCLSYYSTRNIPRHRGRLYVPWALFGTSVGSVRPSSGNRDSVAALVPILTDLGGADVDWCVYSRADDEAYSVTDWWIDDEWDTMRSRGLRASTRTTGTTSE